MVNSTVRPAAASQNRLPEKPGNGAMAVTCPACNQANLSDRKFCTKCGQSLWRICLQCGVECGASETFCGACGANDRDLVAARLKDIAAAVQLAQDSRQNGDFSPGLRALSRLQNSDHPQICAQLAAAKALAAELTAEKKQLEQETELAIREAARYIEQRQFKEALLQLNAIRPALRTQEARQLMDSAEQVYREIKQLRGEIAAEVEARRMAQVGPKIDRYLALQPDDERVQVLSTRVREHLIARARAALAATDYGLANRLLECVPLTASNEATQKFGTQLRELVRLQSELRTAAHADQRLLTIAKRLQQLSPHDTKMPPLVAKLTERLKQGPLDPRFPVVPWAPAPKRSQFGVPIHWLGGFRRLHSEDPAVEARLQQHPGDFFVAAGLALQGLGKGRVTINLAPTPETPKILGALRRFRKTITVTSAWGLDVGQSALKVIKLGAGTSSDGEVRILACDHIAYPVNLATAEAESQQAELVAEALRRWREQYQPADDEPVCVNGPASQMLGRFVQIPPVKDSKQAELIAREVRHQIPYPLSDLSWGYQVINPATESRETAAEADASRLVVIAALRARDAKDRLQPFEQSGISVQALQAEPLALYNLIAFECFSPVAGQPSDQLSSTETGPVALLDLGSDISNLVVCAPDCIWFRPIRWGGNDVNRELVREFKLTFAQAEELKRQFGAARRLANLLNILDRSAARLVADVLRSLETFQSEQFHQAVEQIWLCGGGTQHFGLLRQFRSGSATSVVQD